MSTDLIEGTYVRHFGYHSIVELKKLKTKTEWNGKTGLIIGNIDPIKQRYPIQIELNNELKVNALIKPDNLKLIKYVPLFDRISIKNKGNGLIARDNIPQGTIILIEKPFITLTHKIIEQNNYSETNLFIFDIFKQYQSKSKVLQNEYLKLANAHKYEHENMLFDYNIYNIWRTNSYTLDDDKVYQNGLFLVSSYINHSCNPNATPFYNGKTRQRLTIALFDIKKGTEITCNYIGMQIFSPMKVRHKLLMNSHNFKCICKECIKSLKNNEYLKKRDEINRMLNIKLDLQRKYFMKYNFEKGIKECYECVQLINCHYNGRDTILSELYGNMSKGYNVWVKLRILLNIYY